MSDTCFVITPYGEKQDGERNLINFDEIYEFIVKPAVETAGLQPLKCNDIDLPGSIHHEMIRQILSARAAVVDITTLNPNVFYELGIRHALRKNLTVLIRMKNTNSPFNISGMNCITYTTNPKGVQEAKEAIASFIRNGLDDQNHIDSLVYEVIPQLKTTAVPPARITRVELYLYSLLKASGKQIGLLTGDRENITQADIWVNSENLEMQMDRFYGASTSATIRYLGAKKHPISGRVVEDKIANELAAAMGTEMQVDPATVIVTGPGELAPRVKKIFHVAAVKGEPREGYRPIERIERCVTNSLKRASADDIRETGATSILFPIFGTGPASGPLPDHAERCFSAAIDFFETNPATPVSRILFYIWTDEDLAICRSILSHLRDHVAAI